MLVYELDVLQRGEMLFLLMLCLDSGGNNALELGDVVVEVILEYDRGNFPLLILIRIHQHLVHVEAVELQTLFFDFGSSFLRLLLLSLIGRLRNHIRKVLLLVAGLEVDFF